MSLAPWAIAVDPSISTCPAVMYALMRVRRVRAPFPYDPVRHSVLARLPGAPLGHRSALPAAITGGALEARMVTAAKMAASAPRGLYKDGAHEQALGVGEDARAPHATAGDERQRGDRARSEQRRQPRAGANDAPARHLEVQARAIP